MVLLQTWIVSQRLPQVAAAGTQMNFELLLVGPQINFALSTFLRLSSHP